MEVYQRVLESVFRVALASGPYLAPGDVGGGVATALAGNDEVPAHLLEVLCTGGHLE